MDGIQKHLKIRIILIHITDARCGGLYSHARLQILSAVSTVPAEGRGDETVNFAHQGILGPWINRFSGAAMKRWFSWPDDSWQGRHGSDPVGDLDKRHGALGRYLSLAGGGIRVLNW